MQKLRRTSLEPLESRLLFAYTVNGTNGNDTISISISGNDIISAVNGVSDSASDFFNNQIQINGLGGNDTITIVETGDNEVQVDAGSGNDTINIALGGHDLDSIDENIGVDGQTGTDTMILWDDSDTSSGNYEIDGNHVSRPGVPTMIGVVESIVINAGAGDWDVDINDRLVSNFTVNAPIGTNGSNVIIVNGPGTVEPLDMVYSPSSTTFGNGAIDFSFGNSLAFNRCDGVTVLDVDKARLSTPNRTDALTLNSIGVATGLSGTSGGVQITPFTVSDCNELVLRLSSADSVINNDVITCTNGLSGANIVKFNLDAAVGGSTTITINSGTWNLGTETVTSDNFDLVVNGGTATVPANFILGRLEINTGGTFKLSGSGDCLVERTFLTTSGDGTVNLANNQTLISEEAATFGISTGARLFQTGSGLFQLFSFQSNAANARINVQGGVMELSSDPGNSSNHRLTLTAQSGALVKIFDTVHLAGLFSNTAVVELYAPFFTTDTIGTDSNGHIDLRDNDAIIDYTSAATANLVRSLLHIGRNNGAWDGVGINSSNAAEGIGHTTTLASMEATDFKSIYGAGAKFHGENIDNTAVLIKYTYYGDADFNGKVDGADYARLDAKFNQQATQGNIAGFINGDFDDNGKIDGADYALIDAAFNAQGATLRPAVTKSIQNSIHRSSL